MIPAKPKASQTKTLHLLARCVGLRWPEDRTSLQAALMSAEALDLSGAAITDLSPLSDLTTLAALDISETKVKDLSPLAGLTGLTSLKLSKVKAKDHAPLAALTALEHLDLRETRLRDLTPLSGLSRLRAVRLGGNPFTDFSPLAGLAALEEVDLESAKITDLTPLTALPALRRLGLSCCRKLKDFSPLSGLRAVEDLDLSYSHIKDLEPLRGLPALAVLHIGGTRVRRTIEPLVDVPRLRSLKGNMDVGAWTALPRLQALESLSSSAPAPLCAQVGSMKQLSVWIHEAADIRAIAGMPGLTSLCINASQGWDLSPLGVLKGLEALEINIHPAPETPTALAWIGDLGQLERLRIHHANVADFSPLSALTRLRSLDISRNPIADIAWLANLRALVELKLDSLDVHDWSALAALTRLEILELQQSSGKPMDAARVSGATALRVLRAPLTESAPLAKLDGLEQLYIDAPLAPGLIDGMPRLTALSFPADGTDDLAQLTRHRGLRTVYATLPAAAPETQELVRRMVQVPYTR